MILKKYLAATFRFLYAAFDGHVNSVALRSLLLSAELGNVRAMNDLGAILLEGSHYPRDFVKAFRLFQRAADEGSSEAQFNLALLYLNGDGVARDYKLAAKWFELSAVQGNPASQYNIGIMLANGDGVEIDLESAKSWLKKAIYNGVDEARDALNDIAFPSANDASSEK